MLQNIAYLWGLLTIIALKYVVQFIISLLRVLPLEPWTSACVNMSWEVTGESLYVITQKTWGSKGACLPLPANMRKL